MAPGAVHEAEPVFERHGDRHARVGHAVHVGEDEGQLEGQAAGQRRPEPKGERARPGSRSRLRPTSSGPGIQPMSRLRPRNARPGRPARSSRRGLRLLRRAVPPPRGFAEPRASGMDGDASNHVARLLVEHLHARPVGPSGAPPVRRTPLPLTRCGRFETLARGPCPAPPLVRFTQPTRARSGTARGLDGDRRASSGARLATPVLRST